jgi:hypothetical protein
VATGGCGATNKAIKPIKAQAVLKAPVKNQKALKRADLLNQVSDTVDRSGFSRSPYPGGIQRTVLVNTKLAPEVC